MRSHNGEWPHPVHLMCYLLTTLSLLSLPFVLSCTGTLALLMSSGRAELGMFLSQSVLPRTLETYKRHWTLWMNFLEQEISQSDPYLTTFVDEDKTMLVGLFLLRRYEGGHRGKMATSVTAGLRMFFGAKLMSTAFLDDGIIATARVACRLSPVELRQKRDTEASTTVKLPFCYELLLDVRQRLWTGRTWSDNDMKPRMLYLACMWGYDLSARVSEFTKPEKGAPDHCVRVHDLSFLVDLGNGPERILGGDDFFKRAKKVPNLIYLVSECSVLPASSKGKVVIKPKIIGTRSQEERRFLLDIVIFLAHSGTVGSDLLFSFHSEKKQHVVLRAKSVRDELKNTCKLHGLPEEMFSAHSLRKGAMSDMRALGASEDDRRDRGNYAATSTVMAESYEYATGPGPLACMALVGGYLPTTDHLRRFLPPSRHEVQREALDILGEGLSVSRSSPLDLEGEDQR